jgi:hypothetical protein
MRIKLYSLVLLSILLSGCGVAAASEQVDAPTTTTTITVTTPDVANAEAAIAESVGQHIAAVEEQQRRETEAAAASAAAQTQTRSASPNYDPGDGSRWDRLAQCECGGNWGCNTGNGFGGGLQFMHQRSYSTWLSFGGGEFAPHPWEASREQQIIIAERVLASSGWSAWPGCSRGFGWL